MLKSRRSTGVAPIHVDVCTLVPRVQMCVCFHTVLLMTSTDPRGPSHTSGAVLRPPCALETSAGLVATRAPGPEETPFGQGAAGGAGGGGWAPHSGRHVVTGLLHMPQGKDLTPAWAHGQPDCIGWLLWKIRKVRDLAGNRVITSPRTRQAYESQL